MKKYASKLYLSLFVVAWAGWLGACGDEPTPGPLVPNFASPAASRTPPVNRKIGYSDLTGPVAIVDGVAIAAPEFNQALDEGRAITEEQAGGALDWNTTENKELLKNIRLQTLEGLVNFQVVAAAAARQNVTASPPEVEARLEDFKKQLGSPENYKAWLARRFISEADHKKRLAQVILFEEMSERHSAVEEKGEQAHLLHILVGSEAEARTIFQRLQAGEDFGRLARQFSLDAASATRGGDLDWIFRGQTDTAFEQAAFALLPNQTSGPVKTDKGYHLIKLLAKEVRPLPFDLVQQRRSDAFSAYIKTLRDQAKIEILLKV